MQGRDDERNFPCEHCEWRFTTKGNLKKHVQRKHLAPRVKRTYVCARCGKDCKRKDRLAAHVQSAHAEKPRPFACEWCDARFTHKTHLARHKCPLRLRTARPRPLTSKRPRPFACTVCSVRFTTRAIMQRHVSNVHMQDRPHPCPICSSAFKRKGDLKQHVRNVHGLELGVDKRRDEDMVDKVSRI